MGKAVIFLFFAVGFVVFAIIKFAVVGTKAAYEAVFDPGAKDARIGKLVADCTLRVSHAMHQRYSGDLSQLPLAILQLTPVVQSLIMEAGYNVPATVAQKIVCEAIVEGNHASFAEVQNALQMV